MDIRDMDLEGIEKECVEVGELGSPQDDNGIKQIRYTGRPTRGNYR